MNILIQDIRYAFRTLARSSGFAIVAIIVIALGIGSNSALFSVVNAVLLKPLPYPEAHQIMQIQRSIGENRKSDAVSIPNFIYWRDNNTVFESMAAHDGQGGGINLVEGDRPERISNIRVSSAFFDVLGANAQLGRGLEPDDVIVGAEKVAVISDGLWRRRFNADPDVIGRELNLSGDSHTLVGIMPRGFDFKTPADIWTPLPVEAMSESPAAVFYIMGRLKNDATIDQAQADMDRVHEQMRADLPNFVTEGEELSVRTHLDQVVGNVRPILLILLGAVGLVLLIACANVANLLLARSAGRQREMALRATLGASRMRIVRQLLTESAVLALVGGLLGLLVARWGMGALIAVSPDSLPRLDTIEVDGTVFAFTLAVTVVTGMLFGLFPALHACRLDLHEGLKEGATGAGTGRRQGRARAMLVVCEIALSLVLLIGAGLLIDSFRRIIDLDPGFDTEQTLSMKMSLGARQDLNTASFVQFTDQVIERLEVNPGIEAAATVSTLPLEHGLWSFFPLEGETNPDGTPMIGRAPWRIISPNFFKALDIPLLHGRFYDERDTQDSEPVTIINNALAARYFPDGDALGNRLMLGSPDDENPYSRIIGIVGNVREQTLAQDPLPVIYSAAAQMDDGGTSFVARVLPTGLVVRATGDPLALAPFIRKEILAVDPEQPVSSVRVLKDIVSGSIASRSFNTLLLAIFAALALLLAVVGIYGVMSYSVAQRTREIGIRMAIGAARRDMLRLILGQGVKLAAAGVVIGLIGARALTWLMEKMLYEITATDPKTFILMALILLIVATAACLVPALRATRVDPMVALRSE